jgi:ADP-heptose:LPS heptosyltransferase
MMDLPIICETRPDTIPRAEGYLSVSKPKINAYRKEHINNNDKLKIGIAFEGTLASKETDRDIPLEFLYPLMQMPEVEVYSFQVDDLTRQMDRIPDDCNLIRLGKTFKNWEDTACAMNCMDLMVTTDNGVMNLAGALGIKTFGLFNTITEWRWFKTQGEDIAWYKSIKPFQCPTSKAWDVVMNQVVEEVQKIQCQRIAKKIKGF